MTNKTPQTKCSLEILFQIKPKIIQTLLLTNQTYLSIERKDYHVYLDQMLQIDPEELVLLDYLDRLTTCITLLFNKYSYLRKEADINSLTNNAAIMHRKRLKNS